MKNNDKFKRGLEELNIQLDENQLDQFERYYELLIEWNKVMNLTAITEYDEVITKHFLDSLSIVKLDNVSRETLQNAEVKNLGTEAFAVYSALHDKKIQNNNGKEEFVNPCDAEENEKINKKNLRQCNSNQENSNKMNFTSNNVKLLDLGTGAGFPGLPLKIAFPNLEVLLMDSLNKRINFLNEVIQQLSLKNIQAVHGRAEELGRKEEYREQYDCCVSRAVARLVSLSEYCLPFVKKGGYFIPYKSVKSEEELLESNYAIEQLGGKYVRQVSFQLPESDAERTLFLIKKCRETPNKYPRAGGKPANKPLLTK